MTHLTYFDHLIIIATNWGLAFLLFGLSVAGAGIWVLYSHRRSIAAGKTKMSIEKLIGAILLIVAGLVWSYLQTLIPTRYARNPVNAMYTAEQAAALARPLYDEHCALCHGHSGKGDGEIAEFMRPRPADFSIHGWHHREGEHYWWISRGIPGTGMPGFDHALSEEERWLLAKFVRTLGREARLHVDE